MALDPAIKQEIIKEYATHEGDTGSPEVQIAVLSRRISDLTEHLSPPWPPKVLGLQA